MSRAVNSKNHKSLELLLGFNVSRSSFYNIKFLLSKAHLNFYCSMKQAILFLIKFYQKTISLDHGVLARFYGRRICRFHPTCSHYMYDAIEKYGTLKGGWMGTKRFFHCHPWNSGGYDPVK